MQTKDFKALSESIKIPLWGLFIIGVLFVLHVGQSLLIPVFLAILISFMLTPVVLFLMKLRIPRAMASFLVLLISSSLIVLSFNSLSTPAGEWLEKLPKEIRNIDRRLKVFKSSVDNVKEATKKIDDLTEMATGDSSSGQTVQTKPGIVAKMLDSTQSFIGGFLIFIVLLFFILAFGHSLVRQLGRYWKRLEYETNIIKAISDTQQTISRYLFLITAINIVLGLIVAGVMWWLGMPNPLVWGASAALLNYIPYVGPLINISIVAVVSLSTFNTPFNILMPPLALLGLNLLEGQFIQPFFVGKMLTVNPVIVFLFILFWGWIWGVLGIFMAVPILVSIKIILDQKIENQNAKAESEES
ncbi:MULTISPECIES: AI-2E family transporter [unclassified Cocleimonas]|uniref:AI-2E family transporter n=1 Tax=unclassified Cocleimonas TaxID=2639732 RepID=UPI00261756C4|nr:MULTISPECIES: AI-2E family transporter [unclassified Cocleimonas]MEB8431863.1 AI-2E family transporter [Cocleimonas sp. KMM 6892]MEC4715051.1 AI-2E family transporter [Cocleimonas sp. KMM 6895]MEC4744135.1 AI-2E family transporter [Cocleimonas sp. KMM 6896]